MAEISHETDESGNPILPLELAFAMPYTFATSCLVDLSDKVKYHFDRLPNDMVGTTSQMLDIWKSGPVLPRTVS